MKGKLIDLTGKKFGRLFVIKQAERRKYQKPRWLCMCDCGNKKVVESRSLRKGLIKSCGCLNSEKRSERKSAKLDGKRFGRLVVIKRTGVCSDGVQWLCVCDCGKKHISTSHLLNSGHVQSCGCLQRELSSKKLKKIASENIGELNPAWKGGITSEILKYYNSEKHAEWRKAIFERDGYKCLNCGTKKPPFNAHHIKLRSKYPNLKTDINNGITLCKSCHAKIRGKEDAHIDRFTEIIFGGIGKWQSY